MCSAHDAADSAVCVAVQTRTGIEGIDNARQLRGRNHAAGLLKPLLRTRAFLEAQGWWDEARESALRGECAGMIDEAVLGYQNRTPVGTDHMFDHLFARPPAQLAAQRAIARRYGVGDPRH